MTRTKIDWAVLKTGQGVLCPKALACTMNVLVADDDRMSREMLRRIIESDESHSVTLAEDGEQAWKFLCDAKHRFDVGIFDINMPKIDGLRLIERIRATPSLRSMPAILCTAAADRNTVGRASSLAVSHYIIKPYTKNLVLDKLQTVRAEIAKQGLQERSEVLKRLGVDEETYLALAGVVLSELQKWLSLARYTSDLVKFTKLAQRVDGLRGAAALFGLNSLVSRLEEVEFTVVSDSAASQGQASPLLLSQLAPVFEGLAQELSRVERQLKLAE